MKNRSYVRVQEAPFDAGVELDIITLLDLTRNDDLESGKKVRKRILHRQGHRE